MGLDFEGHALSELHFQNATSPGTAPRQEVASVWEK